MPKSKNISFVKLGLGKQLFDGKQIRMELNFKNRK